MKSRIWHKPSKSWLTDYAITQNGSIAILCVAESVFYEDKDDCVVQLSTGVKDKTGREIYYGDLVKERGYVSVVTEVFAAHWVINEDKMNNPSQHIEIIGNIFDNPELLTQKK